ncbi:Methyltransferase type 11 [[Leptolyngbya] sp. PCC 7376]|uniref:methyltransferase domain-containing protein n=1 Tax=[Leptolyngbya] sp. PCC 7376 TaxID=111781 RepID=UPI00029EE5E1|nr:class I SAM-dependent methyltransferase [[Leptolyngbya] sp. PCC 7376]AFY39672.1 Methyltransferase type 11 [[Leptolyngbya] sp. PCC 7376]
MTESNYEIIIPENIEDLVIQEEFFYLLQDGKKRKIRLHDYKELYSIPRLYQSIMEQQQEQSHIVLPSLLKEYIVSSGKKMEDLTILEVGAGSGAVGKTLSDFGVKSIVGIDIVPEAKEAVDRDYPDVYSSYYIEDLNNLSPKTKEALIQQKFDCIVCGSALGFNHIPAKTWAKAFNVIAPNSWIAFNVQNERWENEGTDSFVAWHPWVSDENILNITKTHKYRHRFYLDGRPLYYVAIIGTKVGNIPNS